MKGKIISLAFFFQIMFTLFSSVFTKLDKNEDLSILVSFKKSSVSLDPNGILSNWSENSTSPCLFTGIICSNDGYVTSVNLSGNSLSGTPDLNKITKLPFLTNLDLSRNAFVGKLFIETPVNCLLEKLDLSSNNFTRLSLNLSCSTFVSLNLSNNQILEGSLSLPSSIITIDLSKNVFTNPSLFPLSLSKTPNLNFLNLSHNNISGNLNFLSDFPKTLKVIDLSHNRFTQNITNFQFNSCKNLSILDLSHNALFSSAFPAFLTSCPLLEVLGLGYNRLEFEIPELLSLNLNGLRKLNLARNRIIGEIPEAFGEKFRKLEELDLSGNGLIGGLPLSFSNCSSLVSLNLGNNQLSKDFFDVIDTLTSLKYLHLPFNNLTGEVPLLRSNNSKIVELDLSSNGFTGKIPSGICSSYPLLEKLLLADTDLSGSIPSEIGNCKKLRKIDLSFNEFIGEIPIGVWHLQSLSEIAMWGNKLTGEIPEGLCTNNRNLQMLILNDNLLSGTIPRSISNCSTLIWLSLSSNRLTGIIPPDLGKLINVAILQLGNNSFSGEIPKELGDCRSLVWLNLNSNRLTGEIPFELMKSAGFVKTGPVSGKQYAFVRNEGGASCHGVGGLVEVEGIRSERLNNFQLVSSCSATRIYIGLTMYTFVTNGTLIFLDLSYNSLSGSIPDKMGSLTYLNVLNLAHNNLSGNIPFAFGGLKTVGVIDLSYNSLQGAIPGSFGRLTLLTDLDVSNNNLSGQIPSGGQLTTFATSRYENNSGLCGVPLPKCGSKDKNRKSSVSDNRQGGKRPSTGTIIGAVVAGLLFVIVVFLALYIIKRKQSKASKGGKYIDSLPTSGTNSWKLSGAGEPLSINVATFENPLRKLTFAHLLKATNGFSSDSLIGSGGFGEVYKAQLKDGHVVAIKKLIHATSQGEREFIAEMETIGKVRHENLVPLLGYCKVGDERLLVYEYMKWGSLESVLHENKESKLSWGARKRIAIGSAKGLAFLHHSCIPHIIHRDMKSSNVLLDENFDARVSDFGLARLVSALDSHLSVSTLAGTPGYVPPEYYQSFQCTTKGDVYSYGVILLELLSGKKPIDPVEFGDDNNLVGWAKQLQKEKRMQEIFDQYLVLNEASWAELYQCLKIALDCLDDSSFRRPTMYHVLSMFTELQTGFEDDVNDDVPLKRAVIEV